LSFVIALADVAVHFVYFTSFHVLFVLCCADDVHCMPACQVREWQTKLRKEGRQLDRQILGS